MAELYGWGIYLTTLAAACGIYAIIALGLNIQWGFTGLFNAGIAGFVAVGAYVFAILTTPPNDAHLGGYGWPLLAAAPVAMLVSAVVAWGVARICIRLRSDYLAIATIGIAEILRLGLKNEDWLSNGPRGISGVPKAFESLPDVWAKLAFTALVLASIAVIYILLERAWASPWGRVMTAIRDSEAAARAAGKDVEAFRIESFVLGAVIMGLAGAYLAQYNKVIVPDSFDPASTTFLVWVMLIAGGSGNNRGAILGAFVVYAIWSMTEILTTKFLPPDMAIRAAYLRIFLIGLVLQFVLQRYPGGILPETRPAVAGKPRQAGPKTGSST